MKNNKDLYKETFSQLHTSVRVDELIKETTMKTHTIFTRRLLTAAVAAALVCALGATAVAFNLFGLRDLAFPERTTLKIPVPVFTQDPDGWEVVDHYDEEIRVVDMITMQGYADTPEAKACVEWQQFWQAYTDSHSFGNDIYDENGRYSLYGVFDDTMAAKLDEIVAKYGLSLHQTMTELDGTGDLRGEVGATFLGEGNTCYWGYLYDDGTFSFEGEAEQVDYGILDYQFRYVRKGVFDEVALNAGNLADYTEWDYTTEGGVALKLALGPQRSFIWAETGEGFLFVNVLTGFEGDDTFSSGPIGQAELEKLAEQFDFSLLG